MDRIFSGMQPSGDATLGNYLGALKNWHELQQNYESIYCVVDMHAITVKQEELKKKCLNLTSLYLACGLNPDKSIIYYQSSVKQHAELFWILSCYTYVGELNRMTQFKDKSKKNGDNINVGLYNYPVLMAADILLFNPDLVPVGEDQIQHLELCRDIANRFNNLYGETFKIPKNYISKQGAKIMSLKNPSVKMSKSDQDINSCIYLLDSKDTIINKIKKSVTDSENKVIYNDEKLGIKNLINIYSSITGENILEIENKFLNLGYGKFKQDVADAIINELEPIQEKYNYFIKNEDYVNNIMQNGKEKAQIIAENNLKIIKQKIGYPLL